MYRSYEGKQVLANQFDDRYEQDMDYHTQVPVQSMRHD